MKNHRRKLQSMKMFDVLRFPSVVQKPLQQQHLLYLPRIGLILVFVLFVAPVTGSGSGAEESGDLLTSGRFFLYLSTYWWNCGRLSWWWVGLVDYIYLSTCNFTVNLPVYLHVNLSTCPSSCQSYYRSAYLLISLPISLMARGSILVGCAADPKKSAIATRRICCCSLYLFRSFSPKNL